MSLGRQAKVLSKAQITTTLLYLKARPYALRNTVIFLLSVKAGLRAKEIAQLKWGCLLCADGKIGDVIALDDRYTKGTSGRIIPINRDLRVALDDWLDEFKRCYRIDDTQPLESWNVITTSRSYQTSAQVIVNTMRDWYADLGFVGASSHSGRRTFITNAAKQVFKAGGSLRDVQELAGHKSIAMTQRYIEGDSEAKRRLVDLI
jgi:integrase